MKKTLLFLAFIILAALPLKAQVIGQPVTIVNTAPGTCTTNIDLAQEYQGVIYICVGGNYAAVSTTAAGGSVTGLHAGRVVVGASATTLTDYAGLTYDGSLLTTLTSDSATNSVSTSPIAISHQTSGVPATGLGTGLSFFLSETAGGTPVEAARIEAQWGNSAVDRGVISFKFRYSSPNAFVTTEKIQMYLAATTGLPAVLNFPEGNGRITGVTSLDLGSSGTLQYGGGTLVQVTRTGNSLALQGYPYVRFDDTLNTRTSVIGGLGLGINKTTAAAALDIVNVDSTAVGAVVKLAASQSADALQVQNSSSTILTSVTKDGYLNVLVDGAAANPAIAIRNSSTGFYAATGAVYSGILPVYSGSISGVAFVGSGTNLGDGYNFRWTINGNPLAAVDVGIGRNVTANRLEINTGVSGTYADLITRSATFSRAGEQLLVLNNTSSTVPNVTIGIGSGSQHTDGDFFVDAASTPTVANQLFAFSYSATATVFTLGKANDSANVVIRAKNTSSPFLIQDNVTPATAQDGIQLGSMNQGSSTATSGTRRNVLMGSSGFAPTSGTAVYNHLELQPTINQTGGASGIARGIYVNPTLTAAADWRGIQVNMSATAATNQAGIVVGGATNSTNSTLLLLGTATVPSGTYSIYQGSTTAPAYFNGSNATGYIGIGAQPAANILVNASASITDPASATYGMLFSRAITLTGNNAQTATGIEAKVTYTTGAFNPTGGNFGAVGSVWMQTTGTMTRGTGVLGYLYNTVAGTITSAAGVKAGIQNLNASGVVTNFYSFYANDSADIGFNNGTISNLYGLYIANPPNAGTLTNNYGLYIASQTSGGTLNYAIYSAGGASLLNAGTSTVVPLTLKGAASQSGDLTQWQNSSGTVLSKTTSAGFFLAPDGSASGAAYSFINSATSGMGFASGSTQLEFYVNAVRRFYINGTTVSSQATNFDLGGWFVLNAAAAGGLGLGSGHVVVWGSSSTNSGISGDTNFSRISAGLIGVGTGAAASVAGSMSMTNLTLAGVANMAAGSVSAPSINFTDTATGFYRTGTNAVGVSLNGVNGLRFDPNYGLLFRSDYYAAWASSTAYAAADVGILRSAVNTIKISDASSGFGDLTLRGITMTGNFFAGPSTIESFTTNASALGTLNYYTDSQTIYYDTAAATGNVTVAVKAAAGTNLDTRLATGQAVTLVLKITNTGTAYNIAALTIDGGAQTIKWLNGSAPAGNINAVDTYTFYIYKTGSATFYVEGTQQSYK